MLQSSFNNEPLQGWWTKGDKPPEQGDHAVKTALMQVTNPVFLLNSGGRIAVGRGGTFRIGGFAGKEPRGCPVLAYIPALTPENLGSHRFKKSYNLRYAYIAGAMANGITSVQMVEEMGRAGMIGFFGAAGLPLDEIDVAINRLKHRMNNLPFGFNLIHRPGDPEQEAALIDLYLERGIRRISASAYMEITPPLVHFRVKGIHREPGGSIVCPNKIIAKVSRAEIAVKFFSPPHEKLLAHLVDRKMISPEEAHLAKEIPLAEDLTAEADSGGHTDNRPALALLPTMLALRDRMVATYKYTRPPCVGIGGGIATPYSAAAAFAMGADYIVTGSINQSCIEAGTSEIVRRMLAEAGQADVAMAPAADMFEMGIKVQVLKRGTMFPFRAAKLYDLYHRYDSLENIPAKEKLLLERDFFRCSFQEEWQRTISFFEKRDPKQLFLAGKDPKHKMALVFRSYLGRSSTWAKTGEPSRKIDYQIWCGPAIGAFNEWVKGSFLEKPENRTVVAVAMNLLFGASVITRANCLRNQGVGFFEGLSQFEPMELRKMLDLLNEHPV
jgi:trans-AT polyketide synthase/acyltransferase/oxidoreductase domain-containing protein